MNVKECGKQTNAKNPLKYSQIFQRNQSIFLFSFLQFFQNNLIYQNISILNNDNNCLKLFYGLNPNIFS